MCLPRRRLLMVRQHGQAPEHPADQLPERRAVLCLGLRVPDRQEPEQRCAHQPFQGLPVCIHCWCMHLGQRKFHSPFPRTQLCSMLTYGDHLGRQPLEHRTDQLPQGRLQVQDELSSTPLRRPTLSFLLYTDWIGLTIYTPMLNYTRTQTHVYTGCTCLQLTMPYA
jgi:hypothetical protein